MPSHLDRLQQQTGAEETHGAGDQPHYGHGVAEPSTRPNGDAAGQTDPDPAAPQGGEPAPGREPSGAAHVCHHWGQTNGKRQMFRYRFDFYSLFEFKRLQGRVPGL